MEGFELQILVYLNYHHGPEKFSQWLITSFLNQKDIPRYQNEMMLTFQYQ